MAENVETAVFESTENTAECIVYALCSDESQFP